ncbi:response regulator transcription factor [Flavihumibacter rivuli]|uniref:LytR/AlgR family response regulator transcription factor n=1 Tax=Flavihumibacter rivuli TaxID=2838156 RepID=UPI001BDDD931|nr:response regulator transcription factor [Flavihumibacter rivuli]ULQ55899.1 response regulator transcription factor [Flavihumibacter rivuli]
MRNINCIIIEDEPIAAEVLEDYIKQVPFLQLKQSFRDPVSAIDYLFHENTDMIFLDINLPQMNGMDFLRTLNNPPKIIVTTAYQEYALKGYELDVLDYLLKPIEFSRFMIAVNKLKQEISKGTNYSREQVYADKPHLFFNMNKKLVKVYLEDILSIESLKEYIRITTTGRTILTKMQISEIEQVLPASLFIRIHRSFIVSRKKIDAFTATDVEIKGKLIPIGRIYKEQVFQSLTAIGRSLPEQS